MPRYRITDPATGETMVVSGDSPPSQDQAAQIFASRSKPEQPARDPAYAKEHAPWPFGSGSEGMAMARTVALPLAAFPLAAATGGPGAGAALLRTGARVVSGAAAASEGASAVQKAKRGDFIGAGKDALLAYVFSRGMKGAVPAALPAEAEAAALPAAARRAMTEAEKQALMPGTVAGAPEVATAGGFSKLVGGIAPGEAKVVNGIRYVWGPKGGWFEPAAEKAARLAAEAAPTATVAAEAAPVAKTVSALPEAARKVMGSAGASDKAALMQFGKEAAARDPKIGEKIWVLLDKAGNPVKVLTPDQAGAAKRAGEATTWVRNIWGK